MMILASSLITGGVIIAIGAVVYLLAGPRSLTPAERARRDYLLARERVDAVLQTAKHRMEVMTGMRRHGERRMSDTFGSWKDML